MQKWLIYKHTSMESGKSYIGLTKKTMEKRWKEHCGQANWKLRDKRAKSHFQHAISLYGTENWTHEVLFDNITTAEEASSLEIYAIKQHDTFENGYNSHSGGYAGYEATKSTRELISKRYKERNGSVMNTFYNPVLDEKVTGYSSDANIVKLMGKKASAVVAGNVRHSKNWFLWVGEEGNYEIWRNHVYTWSHDEYGTDKLTIAQMGDKYGLNRSSLKKVQQGIFSQTRGWTIKQNKDK